MVVPFTAREDDHVVAAPVLHAIGASVSRTAQASSRRRCLAAPCWESSAGLFAETREGRVVGLWVTLWRSFGHGAKGQDRRAVQLPQPRSCSVCVAHDGDTKDAVTLRRMDRAARVEKKHQRRNQHQAFRHGASSRERRRLPRRRKERGNNLPHLSPFSPDRLPDELTTATCDDATASYYERPASDRSNTSAPRCWRPPKATSAAATSGTSAGAGFFSSSHRVSQRTAYTSRCWGSRRATSAVSSSASSRSSWPLHAPRSPRRRGCRARALGGIGRWPCARPWRARRRGDS